MNGEAILNTAIATGVTFLDTADCYGSGTSETIIGQKMSTLSNRSDFFIATKVPRIGVSDSADWKVEITEAAIRHRVADCASRLGDKPMSTCNM